MEDVTYQQYLGIKGQYPECLVLFVLGDFCEALEQDAETLAHVTGTIIVKVRGHKMAGFPKAMMESEIGKLLAAGVKVALAEQVKQAPNGEQVTRLVTQAALF